MLSEIHPSLLYLWDKRTLYIGPLFEPLDLSQGAATLVLALDKPISFLEKGQSKSIECRSLLLPAGLSVAIDTQDAIVANCNLDALGADFSALSDRMQCRQGKVAWQLNNEPDVIVRLMEMYANQMSSQAAYELLDQVLSPKLESEYAVDQRVVNVINLIKQTIDSNLSVEDLATEVNLSVPRLVQLFKQQTGIPIRRYRLWHRLYVTSVKMGQGYNLTDAAIAAGFTDSSHCSHTFRSMLGLKPSLILSQPNKIRIITPHVPHILNNVGALV